MPCLREQDTSVSRTPRAELLIVTQAGEAVVAEQQRPTRAYLAVLELHRLIAFGAGALMQGRRAHAHFSSMTIVNGAPHPGLPANAMVDRLGGLTPPKN